jgi:hypothetical protein
VSSAQIELEALQSRVDDDRDTIARDVREQVCNFCFWSEMENGIRVFFISYFIFANDIFEIV